MTHQDKQDTRIDHLIIVVPDLQDATDQYSTLLGRPPSWQGTHPDYGTANTLFQLDNIYLELLAIKGNGPAADIVRTLLDKRGSSLGGLVFGTQDATAFIKRARSFDLMASEPIPGQGIDDNTGVQRHWRISFGTRRPREASSRFVLSTARPLLCRCRRCWLNHPLLLSIMSL
jgi:catechol 2,3-dioxygenase-like lactoylglutathione lyase family enzyme